MLPPPPPARPPLHVRVRAVLADLGPAAPMCVVACAGPLLGVAVLAATTSVWSGWFGDGIVSALVFVGIGIVATAGCLLPTHATSLVAGYLFGGWLGSLVAWLVIVLAAMFAFWLLRHLVGERVVQAIARSQRGEIVHRALFGRGFLRTAWLVALLRLSPLLPFAASNLLFAALGVQGRTFVIATVVGVTPRALAVAWLGAGLSELDWNASGSWVWTAVAIGVTVLVLWVAGRSARAALRRELGTGQ
jgi:uncharacterized membrane protein YdjX (TVP38/TMEM64 family)